MGDTDLRAGKATNSFKQSAKAWGCKGSRFVWAVWLASFSAMQYTGQIQDGQMHGRGTLVYPNSERYDVRVFSHSHGLIRYPQSFYTPCCRYDFG